MKTTTLLEDKHNFQSSEELVYLKMVNLNKKTMVQSLV